jgi:hypothetical protein
MHNIDALEQIVNYAMDKDIPYFAVNVPNDTCLDCGYTGEFNDNYPASEHIRFVESIDEGQNATRDITISPDDGYHIVSITLNGLNYDYTLDGDGNVVIP